MLRKIMQNNIENFLLINFTGNDDCLAIKFNNSFFVKKIQNNAHNSDKLVNCIFDFLKANSIIIKKNFSIIVNMGPGSFTAVRVAIAVAKGIQIAKDVKLFGYKSQQINEFNLENIELLIKSKNLENKLIKPVYSLN